MHSRSDDFLEQLLSKWFFKVQASASYSSVIQNRRLPGPHGRKESSQSFGLEKTQINAAHRPLVSISHLALPNYIGAEKWGENS